MTYGGRGEAIVSTTHGGPFLCVCGGGGGGGGGGRG